MSFFSKLNPFKKKIPVRETIADDNKMALDVAILMREVVTAGFVEQYSVATNATMSAILSVIRAAIRKDYEIDLLLSDETYTISKKNLKRIKLSSVSTVVNEEKKITIRHYRLDVTISTEGKKDTQTILRITPVNFNGLYLRQGKYITDLTGIFPDCKPFLPISDLYKALNRPRAKGTDSEETSNVLPFEIPKKRKSQ